MPGQMPRARFGSAGVALLVIISAERIALDAVQRKLRLAVFRDVIAVLAERVEVRLVIDPDLVRARLAGRLVQRGDVRRRCFGRIEQHGLRRFDVLEERPERVLGLFDLRLARHLCLFRSVRCFRLTPY